MIIRQLQTNDLKQLKGIWKEFYQDQFDMPNFLEKYLGTFVIADYDNNIITAGGIHTIAEATLLTNKDMSPRKRIEALSVALGNCKAITRLSGYNQFHTFLDKDSSWEAILKEKGFIQAVNKLFFLEV